MNDANYKPFSLSPISQEEFAQLDYRVMRHAFECQNQLGRLCEEVIYQNDLAARLQAAGLSALKQCFHLLNPETAFRVTALTEGAADYEHHLRSLLRLSPLRTMQWVNFARQRVQRPDKTAQVRKIGSRK